MSDGLRARGLRLRRGGRLVLDGAGLRLPSGTVTALLGPSGAGKSSLLRCLVRLEDPEAGQIHLGSGSGLETEHRAREPDRAPSAVDVRDLDPRELRRRVGLVPQAAVMLPGTVEENLAYGLGAPGDPAACLAAAGLGAGYLPRDARRLSGGESARVAIARALARDPEVLLLDEPTSALDPPVAAALEARLVKLAAGGLAVAVATHDRRMAARVASRAVLVVAGRTPVEGRPDEVVAAWP